MGVLPLRCPPVAMTGVGRSGFEAEGEFFDDWIGEYFAGDALDFELRLGGIRGQRVFQGELEVFSLADIGDAVPIHAAECASYGLALGIEN